MLHVFIMNPPSLIVLEREVAYLRAIKREQSQKTSELGRVIGISERCQVK